MTLDDLKALAEKAKAWRPERECGGVEELSCGIDAAGRGVIRCDHCLGAQRACDDIASNVNAAHQIARDCDPPLHPEGNPARLIRELTNDMERVASYFGSESNPVAEFAKAVREYCK